MKKKKWGLEGLKVYKLMSGGAGIQVGSSWHPSLWPFCHDTLHGASPADCGPANFLNLLYENTHCHIIKFYAELYLT